jgi:hypothetical protein
MLATGGGSSGLISSFGLQGRQPLDLARRIPLPSEQFEQLR